MSKHLSFLQLNISNTSQLDCLKMYPIRTIVFLAIVLFLWGIMIILSIVTALVLGFVLFGWLQLGALISVIAAIGTFIILSLIFSVSPLFCASFSSLLRLHTADGHSSNASVLRSGDNPPWKFRATTYALTFPDSPHALYIFYFIFFLLQDTTLLNHSFVIY